MIRGTKFVLPVQEFRLELAGGQIPADGRLPISGNAVSRVVPEKRLLFSDRAWDAITSGKDVDVCAGATHETVWTDVMSVLGLADIGMTPEGRAPISGHLDGNDSRVRDLYPKLLPNSPFAGHFRQSIGGTMIGLARVYSTPGAEFSCSDWLWNHLFICRAESAVHEQASVMAMADAGVESDPIYRAAFAAVGCDPESLAIQHELLGLKETMFGPAIDPQLIRSNADRVFAGLASALDRAGTSVTTRPWGPTVATALPSFESTQFVLAGDTPDQCLLPVFEPSGDLNLNAAFAVVEAAFPTEDQRVIGLAARLTDLYKGAVPPVISVPNEEDRPVKPSIRDRIVDAVDSIVFGAAEDPPAPEPVAPDPPPVVDPPVAVDPPAPDPAPAPAPEPSPAPAPAPAPALDPAIVAPVVETVLAKILTEYNLTPKVTAPEPPAPEPVALEPAPEPAPAPEPTPAPPKPVTIEDVRAMISEVVAATPARPVAPASTQIPLLPVGAGEFPQPEEIPAESIFHDPQLTPCE